MRASLWALQDDARRLQAEIEAAFAQSHVNNVETAEVLIVAHHALAKVIKVLDKPVQPPLPLTYGASAHSTTVDTETGPVADSSEPVVETADPADGREHANCCLSDHSLADLMRQVRGD